MNNLMNNQSQYVTTPPHPQNSIDIFKGAWSSKFPEPYAHLEAGSALLFQDARLEWSIDQVGGVKGKTVLELGPLEAGHTYMLEQQGAKSILAIEANKSAYLKCLIVKELLQLQRARFLCGDFTRYLHTCTEQFDFCLASGVLYHMRNPVDLLARLAPLTDQIYIWTHYYNEQVLKQRPDFANRTLSKSEIDFQGITYTVYRHEYGQALSRADFCGGTVHYSHWMQRGDILDCLCRLGYDDIRTNFEEPGHIHGPCFSITAIRTQPEMKPAYVEESILREPEYLSETVRNSSDASNRSFFHTVKSWFKLNDSSDN